MTEDQRSKDHHYIPQAVQKAFAVEGTQQNIWFSKRDSRSGLFRKPQLRNVESTFFERNLYTITVDDKRSDIIERKYYGAIDDFLGKLLPEVLSALNRGYVPTLGDETERHLRLVVMEMLKRTPHAFEGVDMDEQIERMFLSMNSDNIPQELIAELKKEFSDPRQRESFIKEIAAKGRTGPNPKIAGELDNFTIKWAATDGKHAFILSSRYCYMVGSGDVPALSRERVEVWMPISPRYCLVMLRKSVRGVADVTMIDSDKVRNFNLHAARTSTSIGSHSRKLVESIASKCNSIHRSVLSNPSL